MVLEGLERDHCFEDAFFRPSRFIQASWGKGRQLVLVPVIFKIPDSCQALDLFVVLQNFRRDETPLYWYRYPTIIIYSGFGDDLIGTPM